MGLPLKINSAREWFCAPDYYWETDDFPWRDMCLWFVRRGRGTVDHGDRKIVAAPGSCFILRGTDRYTAYNRSDDPFVVMAVHYDLLDPQGRAVPPASNNAPPLHRPMTDPAFFSGLLRRVIDRFEPAPAESLVWFRAALSEVEAEDRRPAPASGGRAVEIERICRAIRAEPHRVYTIGRLARRLSCTPDHFTRVFKRAAGTTPREFIVSARVEAAKALLKSSSHAIGRVAELLGYSDTYFFSRQFKEKTGLSPGAFRKI